MECLEQKIDEVIKLNQWQLKALHILERMYL